MSEEKKSEVPFDLASTIENAFLMGIGVLEMTREKTGEVADDLIERGKMSKSDAKRVADRIGEVAEEQQQSIRAVVAKETDRAMRTTGVATKSDLDELKAEIAELKALIMASTGAAPSTVPSEPLDEPVVE